MFIRVSFKQFRYIFRNLSVWWPKDYLWQTSLMQQYMAPKSLFICCAGWTISYPMQDYTMNYFPLHLCHPPHPNHTHNLKSLYLHMRFSVQYWHTSLLVIGGDYDWPTLYQIPIALNSIWSIPHQTYPFPILQFNSIYFYMLLYTIGYAI